MLRQVIKRTDTNEYFVFHWGNTDVQFGELEEAELFDGHAAFDARGRLSRWIDRELLKIVKVKVTLKEIEE